MGEKEFEHIGDFYKYSADGTLYHTEGKQDKNGNTYEEVSTIANHTPLLKEQRIVDNGVETTEELVFSVLRDFKQSEDIAITLKDILGQTPQIKFGAACRIYLGRGAKSRYSEAMQIQCENTPVKRIFQHTGYTLVEGKRVFLNGDYSVAEDGLTDKHTVVLAGQLENYSFTNEQDENRFETLLTLLPSVAPQAMTYAGLGLSFLTPLNTLLRENGIEPCFILYFTGKTGARKTTMAKLFLNFFGRFDNGTSPPASFRDTANSVEKKFALTDSTLVLLDDRIPSTTPKIKAQMESMEQEIARQIGDRSGRSRMNADGSLRAIYRPKCNLIVTAEEAYSNVGESAVARSLSVELKPGDIDLTALTKAQANARHLNQCMSGYIQFVIKNWDSISEQVGPLFMKQRDKAQIGGHGRLAECVAHLQIGIIYMCEWLITEGVIDKAQADKMQSVAWSEFMTLAENQNRRISEERPVKLFLDAVREMRDQGTLKIVDWDKRNEYNLSSTVGYKDDDFYYLYPKEVYSQARRFYDEQGKTFPLSKTALFQQLAIDGLIEPDKDQNTKAKMIDAQRGKRPRLLWLKVSALDAQQEQEE